jgi:hypothetical protein
MSRTTGGVLLVLGLLAAAALVLWALEDGADEDGFALDGGADTRRAPQAAEPNAPPAPPAANESRARDGVPRVLPPDAAIEDVRDALALVDEAARVQALQAAYAAITRLVTDSQVVDGLQHYVLRVEDPIARGVVLAALGASRDGRTLAWLAKRLRDGASSEERTGAFLGLVYASSGEQLRCSNTLGGFTHTFDALPSSGLVLAAMAGWLDQETATTAADAVVPLTHLVANEVDVAALLVVDDKRPCKLYATLDDTARELMRNAALKHAALPGAVRRVLAAAR